MENPSVDCESGSAACCNGIRNLIHKLENLHQNIANAIQELRQVENDCTQLHKGRVTGISYQSALSKENYLERFQDKLKIVEKDIADSVKDAEAIIAPTLKTCNGIQKFDRPASWSKASGKPYTLERPLTDEEYLRYGRQLIMPQIGLQGQLLLKKASVLIIGVGGLGCPAATYLANAGVGRLGLVDGDTVELSNLHRQTLHCTRDVGKFKVDSAIESLEETNPNVTYEAYRFHIFSENAVSLLANYDLILDCTDHPTSRYLISDAAVVLCKPLVSASALRTEGQLMVLNYPATAPGSSSGGPCYRCIFPKPPPAAAVISCGEGGILGPVVGVMGVLQALEAMKILVQPSESYDFEPSMLLFSAFSKQAFRRVRLRGRRSSCIACSEQTEMTIRSITNGETDYVTFCGLTESVNVLDPKERISSEQFASELQNDPAMTGLLVDVRDGTQFQLCHIAGSINIPYSDILEWNSVSDVDDRLLETDKQNNSRPVRFVCRYGNDSQLAVQRLKTLGLWQGNNSSVQDIEGGWKAWRSRVDDGWPEY